MTAPETPPAAAVPPTPPAPDAATALAIAVWEHPRPQSKSRSKPPCDWDDLLPVVQAGYVDSARSWLTRAAELAGAVPDTGHPDAEEPDEDAVMAGDVCAMAAQTIAQPAGAPPWLDAIPESAREHLDAWLRTEAALFRTDASRGSPHGFPSWHFAHAVIRSWHLAQITEADTAAAVSSGDTEPPAHARSVSPAMADSQLRNWMRGVRAAPPTREAVAALLDEYRRRGALLNRLADLRDTAGSGVTGQPDTAADKLAALGVCPHEDCPYDRAVDQPDCGNHEERMT